MKQKLAVLLAVLLLLALSGCAGGRQSGSIEPEPGESQNSPAETDKVDSEALWQRLAGVWQKEDGSYLRFYTRGSQLRVEVGVLDGEGVCSVHSDGELSRCLQSDHEYTLTISFDATADASAYVYSMYLSDLNAASGSLLASDTLDNGRVGAFRYVGESIQQLQQDLQQQEADLAEIWQSVQGVWVCYYADEDVYYFTMQTTGADGEMRYATGIPFSGAMLSGPVSGIRAEEDGRFVVTVDFPAEEASEMSEARDAFRMDIRMDTSGVADGELRCTIPFAAPDTLVRFRYAGTDLQSITFEMLESLGG